MARALTTLASPRMVGLHLLTIVATTAAVLLGIWQYGAWQTHRDSQVQSLAHAAAKPLASVMTSDQAFPGTAVGQPVELSGQWLPHDTFYVSHRRLHGRTGFWAVTPVAVCRAGAPDCARAPAMLVVRGWTPTLAAAPAAPHGRVTVTGWLQPAEGSGGSDRDPTDHVLPQLRIADVIQQVDQDLYGGYVIEQSVSTPGGGTEHGLAAVTPGSLPSPQTFTAVRNLLYALEWWVFGGFAVFLWWRWCGDEVRLVSEDTEPPAPENDPADPEVASRT